MKKTGNRFRRVFSAMTAVAIAASMNIGEVFAANTTYSVSNDTIVLKSQDAAFSSADSVSIDVKTAAEGFHDYVLEQSNVQPFTTRMFGDHGVSVEITVKDSGGDALAYSGNLEVSYKIPESWDQSHGIAVAYLTTGYIGTLEVMAYAAINNVEIKDGYATFTMPFDSQTSADQTRLLIQEDVVAADVNSLSDGVYQVGISMLKELNNKSISMAASTMNPDALYIVDGEKRYLKLHFNKGIVLNMPAFLNKIYAVDGKDQKTILKPGVTLQYYSDEEAVTFSRKVLTATYLAYGYSQEEVDQLVAAAGPQNGIRYISDVIVNVTNSMQENGCYILGFCSDIMDTLYNGVAGSDNGYNTTNIMVSNPVKTDRKVSDLLPKIKADKSSLDDIFAKFLDMAGSPNAEYRYFYDDEWFNTSYVPMWSKLYQAYATADATAASVADVLKDAQAVYEGKIYIKDKDSARPYRSRLNSLIKSAKKDNAELYTTKSYQAMQEIISQAETVSANADALRKDVVESYLALLTARQNLALKASDYSDLQAAVDNAKKISSDGYSQSSYQALVDAIRQAETMIAAQDSSAEEISAQIKAIDDAKSNLISFSALPDGLYKVDITMLKINREDPSMAGGAINPTVKLEVVDGIYYATLDFKGMSYLSRYGYLAKLWYYDSGYTYSEFGEPQGDLVAADVLATQKNSDGTDVIDEFNDAENLYPDLLKIRLTDTALADPDGYVPLRVMVPIMESIAVGSGEQNVMMQIHWDSLEQTTEDDPDIQPIEDQELSPAVDITDEATGIKVHADKGVFGEGAKLVVNAITSGADYDKAVQALADISGKFLLYDISFLDAEGGTVQPNGTVTVSYPVPENFDAEKVSLYRINDDGTVTKINGTYADGYFTVITKSFSLYALTNTASEENNETPVPDDENKNPSTGDSTPDSDNPKTGAATAGGALLAMMISAAAVMKFRKSHSESLTDSFSTKGKK